MLKKDKEILKELLESYSAYELVSALSQIATDKADEFSDLGLKERAVSYVGLSEMLQDIKDVVVDSDI